MQRRIKRKCCLLNSFASIEFWPGLARTIQVLAGAPFSASSG